MFYQGDIIGIHLEPTSKCNAKCPQCPRNVFGSSHLLDNLQEEDFPIELLDQIDIAVGKVQQPNIFTTGGCINWKEFRIEFSCLSYANLGFITYQTGISYTHIP